MAEASWELGPLATSLSSEPLLFTSSEQDQRSSSTQVGGQGPRFRQKVRRTAHSPQCQGHGLQHSCPLPWPSAALALFPEPLPPRAPHFNLPKLLSAPSDTLRHLPGMPSPLFYPLANSWDQVGGHSPVSDPPHLLTRWGFSGQGPVWLLVHRVSSTPRAH